LLVALVLLLPAPTAATEPNQARPISSLLNCDRPVTPPRCVSVGDNTWHFVYIDPSVPADLAASLRRAMADVYDPTTLVVIEQTEVNALTDAIAYADDHGQNGAAGWTYCPPDAPQGTNAHGHRWCRHQEIHFNLNVRYAVFFGDEASRNHLACHELGHTLGLRHWGNPPASAGPLAATCMNADTPNGPIDLHEWDRENIDAYYAAPPEPSRRCFSRF
jgi:matrixin